MKTSVRHIVMFDFSNLSTEKINYLIEGFENLKQIPEVLHFEWGQEQNAENSSLGFTHCFILTFADFAARTRYLHNALHREYEQEVMQLRKKVLVFDYQMND